MARGKGAASLPLLLGAARSAFSADSCACLNWKQVYSNGMVQCGEALELYLVRNYGGEPNVTGYKKRELAWAHSFAGEEYQRCDLFFKRFDNNLCVNAGPFARGIKEWWGGTWCYVGPECQELNGGKRLAEYSQSWTDWVLGFINDPVVSKVSELSWKMCTPGKDGQLRDLDPEKFFKMSERSSLNLGYGIKLAFSSAWTYLWTDFLTGFLNSTDPELWRRVPDIVQDAVAKREPIVFDSQVGGAGDLYVVRGQDSWHLQFNCDRCATTCFCWSHHPVNTPVGPEPLGGLSEATALEAADSTAGVGASEPAASTEL